MPRRATKAIERVGQIGAEALAAWPFAQTMIEPGEDAFDIHVEAVAGNEIGAEKALPVEGEPVDRGERAADAAADLLATRPTQGAAPARQAARRRSIA